MELITKYKTRKVMGKYYRASAIITDGKVKHIIRDADNSPNYTGRLTKEDAIEDVKKQIEFLKETNQL